MHHPLLPSVALQRCALIAGALVLAPLGVLAQAAETASAMPAQRVVIDPATRKPRMPENDELVAPATSGAAAQGGAAAAAMQAHPMMQRLQSKPVNAQLGAVGHRVDASRLSFSTVRKAADGSVQQQCVTGEDAATHAQHNAGSDAASGARHEQ
jgi:hypothetical protein